MEVIVFNSIGAGQKRGCDRLKIRFQSFVDMHVNVEVRTSSPAALSSATMVFTRWRKQDTVSSSLCFSS